VFLFYYSTLVEYPAESIPSVYAPSPLAPSETAERNAVRSAARPAATFAPHVAVSRIFNRKLQLKSLGDPGILFQFRIRGRGRPDRGHGISLTFFIMDYHVQGLGRLTGGQGHGRWPLKNNLISVAVERHAGCDSDLGFVDIEIEAADNSPAMKASVVPLQALKEVFLLRG